MIGPDRGDEVHVDDVVELRYGKRAHTATVVAVQSQDSPQKKRKTTHFQPTSETG